MRLESQAIEGRQIALAPQALQTDGAKKEAAQFMRGLQ
jgi:hypothetical protein